MFSLDSGHTEPQESGSTADTKSFFQDPQGLFDRVLMALNSGYLGYIRG